MSYQHIILFTRLSIFVLAIHGAFEGSVVESSVLSEDLNDIHVRERSVNANIVNHSRHHDYEEIEEYLTRLQTQYSDHATVGRLNFSTFEGRQVKYIKLYGSPRPNKQVILIDAAIHGSERRAAAGIMFVIEKLLQGYGADPQINISLDKYDWYFIPVANPDGYSFTFTGNANRLWEKNRRIINQTCTGVDLNLNFDFNFGGYDTCRDSKANNYGGKFAFSEPETQNIRDLFSQLMPRIISHVSIHTYGQVIIVPREHKIEEQDRVADLMADTMKSIHSSDYFVYQLDPVDYSSDVSGTSLGWAISKKESIYAYVIEVGSVMRMRDDNRLYGRESTEIVPIGEELLAGLLKMAEVMRL